ncbi:MAG: hypothetical protein ACI8W7_000936 [Gammaproteobacteria bacterium]|jgi:hypothetical protein
MTITCPATFVSLLPDHQQLTDERLLRSARLVEKETRWNSRLQH